MLAAPRRALVALVLVVLTLVSSSCGRSPSASPSASSRASSGPNVTVSAGALQEVAPPAAVQQLNERLNERAPQIKVLAPSDNALLPAGPWSLRLQVSDWPLADAGELGLGPHLVVQLDDQEPLRISREEAAASVAMPELRPGSHRITVYAARPWGEAVKAPGASQQIQVHRVARNGAELPAPGSAQLIAASPDGLQEAEPVLIDWLLLDAPLQNLRGDDARWRLRISVNGDSFLVDRQTPLWIKGFKRGSNAVQLELLDGRGDPLNPPFNSVVREVVIGGGDRPAWQRSSLNANELALLSGERPPAAAPEATPAPEPEPMREPEPQPEPEPISAPQPETPTPAEAELEAPEPQQAETPTPEPLQPAPADPAPSELPLTPEPPEPPTPAVSPSDAAERLTPQTSLGGSARDQVNADGSLQLPPRRGPLAGLREKLGG
ncbi:MAG: hypothetical protein RLZZ186_1184 [Cyanobacteriota bacterium]